MPKLWTKSIEAHRREVHDAVLDAAGALAAEVGIAAVTMSDIAERAGIGRATLYKYFPEVGAVLHAWHARQVRSHLEQMAAIRDGEGPALERLERVLETYAFICHEHHHTDLAALMHREEHVAHAQEHLIDFLGDLIAEAVGGSAVRSDVPTKELSFFCVQALSGADRLPSNAAVRRLVQLVLGAVRGG